MIQADKIFCDECKAEMLAVDEETHLGEGYGGWGDYQTAQSHICDNCYNSWWENSPCKTECRTPWRCEKWGDCWWIPSRFQCQPYETYYAPQKTLFDR